jgi:hypothetical protein
LSAEQLQYRSRNTVVVLNSAIANANRDGSKPAGAWAGIFGLLPRLVLYIGFSEKAKQNRRAARFAALLNLVAHQG